MNSNRIEYDDLADFPGILKGFDSLRKAIEQWAAVSETQSERIRQNMVAIRKEVDANRNAIVSATNLQFKSAVDNGLSRSVHESTQALKLQGDTLKRNETYLRISAAAVDDLQEHVRKLVQEYNELDRTGAGAQKRLNEIQREIRSSSQVLKSLTTVAEKATKATQAAEGSYAALSKQTAEMKKRLREMGDTLDGTTLSFNKNNKAAVELRAQIEKNDKALKSFDYSLGDHQRNVGNYGSAFTGLGKSALGAVAGIIGVSSALDAIKAGLGVLSDFERINAMLKAATKDSDDFNRTQQMLLATADRLGVSYEALAETYKGLKVASRGTAIEGRETERLFKAITARGAQLKMTTDQIQGSLKAFTDMLSKGKIQAEELRGQLGDRMPGAVKLFADALGVSETKLNKMMENGELLAATVLPKVAVQLEKVVGSDNQQKVQSMEAGWNRMTTQAKLFLVALDGGRVSSFFGKVQNGIADVFADLTQLIKSGEWGQFLMYLGGNYGALAEAKAGRAVEQAVAQQKEKFRNSDAPAREKEIQRLQSDLAKKQQELDTILNEAPSKESNKKEKKVTTQIGNLKAQIEEYKKVNKELGDQETENAKRAKAQEDEVNAGKLKQEREKKQREADQALQRKMQLSSTDTSVQLSKLSNDKQDGLVSEEEFIKRRYDITTSGIKARQKLLEEYGKKETDDYRDLAREKLDAETQYHRDSMKRLLAAAKTETETQLKELAIRKEDGTVSEMEYIEERYRITEQGIAKRQDVLKNAGLAESELYRQISNESLDAQRERARDLRKLDEKTWKEAVELTKNSLQQINEEQRSALETRLADLNDWYEQQQQLIELDAAKGNITDIEAEKRLYDLKKEYLQNFVDAQVDSIRTAEQLEQQRLDKLIELADTEEEREQLKQMRLKVIRESQIDVDKAIADNRIKQSDAATKKEVEDAQKIKDARQQALDNYKEAAQVAINAVFDNQKQASDNYLKSLDDQKERELQAVGDNADAKKAIEERYEKQAAAIRRRQAIQEKIQGAFTIGINTAMAVTKALASAPPPANFALAASIGVLGAAQLAAVLSKPLPAYRDGKNVDSGDRYEGPALVGEAGRELWIDGKGEARIVDKPSVVNVGRDDIIYPNTLTEKLLRDDRAFEASEMLHRNQRQRAAVDRIHQNKQQEQVSILTRAHAQSMPSAEAIGREVAKANKTLPVSETHFDESGITQFIREGNNRRTVQESKHRLR